MFRQLLLILVSSNLIASCAIIKKKDLPLAQQIVNKTLEKHGGNAYENLNVRFVFRARAYTIKNQNGLFEYTRSFTEQQQQIKDIINNDGFQRYVNGQQTPVADTMALKYSNSINSVAYFALLPYRLNDQAVVKTYKGITPIKGKNYHTLEVTFKQEGGGTDFDDVFYYWIDTNNYTIDYLAYLFHVDSGGVRFRVAYDPTEVQGVRFQQYINLKASKDTPLAQLPALYEAGQLEELSKIELENLAANQ
ncbi:MAG: hypothetical protein HC892_19660 [Saprospiraceae bacterium]|nr:hypothetical protein [Saprospiraceae bacterium]